MPLKFWKLNTKSYYARGGNECPVRVLSVRPPNFMLELFFRNSTFGHWAHCKCLVGRPKLICQAISKGYQFIEPIISRSLFCFQRMYFLSNFFFFLSPLLSSKPTSLAWIFNRVKNGIARGKDL